MRRYLFGLAWLLVGLPIGASQATTRAQPTVPDACLQCAGFMTATREIVFTYQMDDKLVIKIETISGSQVVGTLGQLRKDWKADK